MGVLVVKRRPALIQRDQAGHNAARDKGASNQSLYKMLRSVSAARLPPILVQIKGRQTLSRPLSDPTLRTEASLGETSPAAPLVQVLDVDFGRA